MSKSFPVVKTEGVVSRQAHADLPIDTFERELGRDGFYGPASHMYHSHPPTSWVEIEGPLKPRAFDTSALEKTVSSPFEACLLLHNDNVAIRYWSCNESMTHLVRNSDGDDLLFIHQGRAEFFCDYGHMSITEGDYVVIPRGTMWRIETKAITMLLIEATDDCYQLPDKGLLGQHAIFDPAMLESPSINDMFVDQKIETRWNVIVKRRNLHSTLTYYYNPLDAVGWRGDLMPVKINWRDIRPIASHRYHVPPSAHSTFVTSNFVVCTFCPRPIESDPGALKVPFFHNNEDYDEVIFYHQGEFFSRDNIHPGMITLHPSGITHGPHPNAFKQGAKYARKRTDEVAVMIDSRAAFLMGERASQIESPEYVDSWKIVTEEKP